MNFCSYSRHPLREMNFAAETGSALKRTQGPRFNLLEQVSYFSRRFQSAGKVVNGYEFFSPKNIG